MMEGLAIFAAGKSSRFGGFPKAFCDLGGSRNVQNTISLAKKHFKKIFLVVNKETYKTGVATGLEAEVISIVTGQGDADSIFKAMKYINPLLTGGTLVACWGDAVFLTDAPFIELEAGLLAWNEKSPVLVGCSRDNQPYAWFDVKGNSIVRSHFRKKVSKPCDIGLHDQSIFAFHTDKLMDYLMRRKHHLGLDVFDENTYDAARGEMGLLDAFTWFYEHPDLYAAEYCLLTPDQVMGFNTAEELEHIKEILKKYRGRNKTIC